MMQDKSSLKSYLSLSLCILLAGCSLPSESFDCKEGKGVGCKSISQVNQLVNDGAVGASHDEELTPMPPPVIIQDSASPDSTGMDLGGEPIIQRMSAEHFRVWMAPFQDVRGNFHEGSVIHTLLKPGYWQIREGL
jgi:hypothetical protein